MVFDGAVRAGQAASGWVGNWGGDRLEDIQAGFGVRNLENMRDPYSRAAKAAREGDYGGLEEALGKFQPVGESEEVQKRQWGRQLSELAKKRADSEESRQIEKLYGNVPKGKGIVTEVQDREQASQAAMARMNIEGQKALANTQGMWGYRTADNQGMWGYRTADLTSGRQLEGVKDTNRTNYNIADITSDRQLRGVQDTNQATRHGQLTEERIQARRSQLDAMVGNRSTTANFIVGAGARSAFRR